VARPNVVTTLPGVEFARIAPAGFAILAALWQASQSLQCDFQITSGTDGQHSGPTDPHYTGEAYDIRTLGLPAGMAAKLAAFLANELGAAFYVLHEMPGDTPQTTGEHLHVQRAKGTVYP
jgi:hypothetical protein